MALTAQEKVIVSAQLPAEMRAELLRLATEGDRSLSAELRRAVVAHLRRTPPNDDDTEVPTS